LIAAVYVYYNPNFEGIVGAELRDLGLRWYRVLVAIVGVSVIVAVVAWTCFEQWRCKGLVESLMEGVGERSALQDRQIVTVIAERSNTVSHLSWKPLQDDLESTASLINEFATQSSNVSFAPARGKVTPEDLGKATKRQAVRDYLGAVIARNETILAGIADLRSGAFSPLALSSILGALLIPVGGAGGLSLLEYIVNQVR
jgi:hypothetical protein